MTPIRTCLNEHEFAYNHAHCKTRVMIENVFGRWKRRFPVLKFPSRRKKIPTILRDIRVAAVLHNFSIEHQIPEPALDEVQILEDDHNPNDEEGDIFDDARQAPLIVLDNF